MSRHIDTLGGIGEVKMLCSMESAICITLGCLGMQSSRRNDNHAATLYFGKHRALVTNIVSRPEIEDFPGTPSVREAYRALTTHGKTVST